MNTRRLIGVVLVLLAGCSRDHDDSPEETVVRFVAAVEQARADSSQRPRVYAMFSSRARASLEARAARASQVSGWELRPWQMLAPGRMRLRVQFDPEALTSRVSGARAIVTARGRTGGAADVPLVREDDRWKIDLDFPPMVEIRPGDVDAGR